METIRHISIIIFLITFVTSCDRDDEPNIPQNNIDAPTIDVKVIVPDGVNLDLSETRLISYLEEFTVDSKGNSNVILNKGGHSLAVLMDKNSSIIMMGMISDNNTEISIKSTAEASLYLSLGKVLSPYVIQRKFLDETDQLPLHENFQNEMETLFKSNTTFFESPEFMKMLKKQTDTIINNGQKVEVYSQRLVMDGADIRSGIQLEEKSGTTFAVANQYRRRAHGFLYKTSTVDKNDNKNILINDIVKDNVNATLDIPITPTKGFTSVTGTVADVGSDFFRTVTDDIPLELADNDKETNYKFRVVGPAFQLFGISGMTKAEITKYRELILETLTFEVGLPIFLAIVGNIEIIDELDGKKLSKYKDALSLFLETIPSVEDAIKQGDLKLAVNEFMKALYNNTLASGMQNVIEVLHGELAAFAATQGSDYFVNNSPAAVDFADRAAAILKVFDGIMLANDVTVRQFNALKNSSHLEEWNLKTTKSNVTLALIDKTALRGISANMEAKVENYELPGGTSFEYHWSTTGKYGILKDDNGKEGKAIVTSRDKVKYVVTASDDEITDESYDGLLLEVFTKKGPTLTKINSDKDTVQVRTHGLRLKPDGITISGNTNLKMYVRYNDGSNIMGANSDSDYRIVWTTSGTNGYFSESGRSTITTVNQTSVNYKCTNWVTERSSESFTARVYSKLKGEPDSKYRILDEVKATITIENDDNKKIFYVPVILKEHSWSNGDGLSLENTYAFKPISPPANKEIVNYRLTIMENWPEPIPRCTGLSKTWYPGNEAKDLDEDGEYALICGSSQTTNPETIARIRAIKRRGYAKVVVTFKPKN